MITHEQTQTYVVLSIGMIEDMEAPKPGAPVVLVLILAILSHYSTDLGKLLKVGGGTKIRPTCYLRFITTYI